MRIKDVVYVYIMFKHSETAEVCLKEFKYDKPMKEFFK